MLARQNERIRAMTADEKVRLSQALWREACNVAAAGVAARHPDWSAEQVAECVRELWSLDTFYCPPAATIIAEHGRGSHGHFNVIHRESAMRADVYLAGADELSAGPRGGGSHAWWKARPSSLRPLST